MANWVKYVGYPFGDRITVDKDGNKKHDINLGGRGQNSFSVSAQLHKKWKQQRNQRKGFADSEHPFLHQGSADLNTYKMFLELSYSLLHPGGRLGMIVPSGIYTDKGTTGLRELFLSYCDWQWLFGFENREGIFDIHKSFKFCSLILQKGGETLALRTAFMRRNVDDWEQAERHVLTYPRERVLEFSPSSKAILEIISEEDLLVLQKIYANGVLLGDQGEQGWGIKYTIEFHMTNDSKLFPPRPKWEEKGYQSDEYGHWLKGSWRPYHGPQHILDRELGLVLSRDGLQAMHVEDIEDVALPLYQGVMIRVFDWNTARHISGAGNRAKWEQQDFDKRWFQPQFLMSMHDFFVQHPGLDGRLLFRDLSNPTNSRTMISAFCPSFPTGNKSPLISTCFGVIGGLSLAAVLGSFVFDYALRIRFATSAGASSINPYILYDLTIVNRYFSDILIMWSAKLSMTSEIFSQQWSKMKYLFERNSFRKNFAITNHERMRCISVLNAIVAFAYSLTTDELAKILEDCDLPVTKVRCKKVSRKLNAKGFWRIDKEKDPELRHTVLSFVAFHDLQKKGLNAFLAQNNGEGWLIPETLRLADYGLGHDERAQEQQPVASRLGPRFFDWQLNEDIERSWQECAAHAELIRRIVPLPTPDEAQEMEKSLVTDLSQGSQGELF